MSYISAVTRGDKVVVWERSPEGRVQVDYPAPYYFYVDDPNGSHTTIFETKVSKQKFKDSKTFRDKRDRLKAEGHRLYESDIPPELKILAQHYYKAPVPKLHVTFYDIEVDYDINIGFSSTENPYAPINSIAILHHWSNKMLVLAVPPPPVENSYPWDKENLLQQVLNVEPTAKVNDKYQIELIVCDNEKQLLLHFLDAIEDSDVICGWNSDMFDTPYIAKRIERVLGARHFARLDFVGCMPRYRDVMSKSKNGEPPRKLGITVDLNGRIRTDYMDLVKKYEPGERASYKLAAVEQDVGLNLPKLEYEGTLHGLYRNNFPYFLRYNIRDTEILGGFEDVLKYVELANQMYHMSCGVFKHVTGTIKLAEYAIVNECRNELNLVVPDFKKSDIDKSIDGALVLFPQIGEHSMVAAIDINSLYPSSIRANNISPETLRGQFYECQQATIEINKRSNVELTMVLDEDPTPITMPAFEWRQWLLQRKWSISGYGTVFDQNKPGIIPTILANWYAQRKHYQKLMREASQQDNEELAGYYDRLQYVYKIKLNSLYGALTNLYFRFYDLRMGESTTGTGRMILKHQCRKVSEILGDGYDVDFPLYETLKDAQESGYDQDVAFHGTVFNGKHQSDSVIYGDTDSTYFKTYATTIEEAITFADFVADEVNKSYKPFMRDMFLCNDTFDDVIKCGREIISDRGIFVDKKRYILHIVDKEGTRCDKMKVMGLDTKKTTLPKATADVLNGFIRMYLTGTPWETVMVDVLEYKDKLRLSADVLDIGLPKGVKGLEQYTQDFELDYNARLPGHVAASIHYNMCLQQYNDKISPKIMSGMKIKVYYIKNANGRFKSIALPTDIEVVPQWFIDDFKIDYGAHITRLVDNPLGNILKAIGRRSPKKIDLLYDDIFGD